MRALSGLYGRSPWSSALSPVAFLVAIYQATLHSLIQAVYLSRRAYIRAAEGLDADALGGVFLLIAGQRTRFVDRLVAELQGRQVPGRCQAVGREAWNLEESLDSGQRALLRSLLVKEDAVLFRYSMAMSCDLPEGIMTMLAHQFAEVGEASDRVRELMGIPST